MESVPLVSLLFFQYHLTPVVWFSAWPAIGNCKTLLRSGTEFSPRLVSPLY